MSASPLAIPVEEYLRSAFRPDCDYVDGTLIERNVGEKDHSKLQFALMLYLHQRRHELGIFVIQEQRIRISSRRYRVPDLCIVAGPEPEEQVFTRAPLVCVEILSPEDRMSRMQERIDDYLSFGVRYVWVLDPQTVKAWIYTADEMREVRDGILRTERPEIVVPLNEIFQIFPAR